MSFRLRNDKGAENATRRNVEREYRGKFERVWYILYLCKNVLHTGRPFSLVFSSTLVVSYKEGKEMLVK